MKMKATTRKPSLKTKSLSYTGERFIPEEKTSVMTLEHYHRYRFAQKYCHNKKVLDIACGEGYGCQILSEAAASVYGCDISKDIIAHAKNKYPKIKFCTGSVEEKLFTENSFDVITCFETIEHVSEKVQASALANFVNYLKPNGVLIISTPNTESPQHVPNSFHKKEFNEKEFYHFLQKYFSFVKIVGQNISCISLITNENKIFPLDVAEKPDIKKARYLIALCSQKGLPDVDSNFLIDMSGQSFIQLAHVKTVIAKLAPWFNLMIKVLAFLMPTQKLKSKISRYRW